MSEIFGCEKITAAWIAAIAMASFTHSPLAAAPPVYLACADTAFGSDAIAAIPIRNSRNTRFMLHLIV